MTPLICRTCKVNPVPLPRPVQRHECPDCLLTQKQRQVDRRSARQQAQRPDVVDTPCIYCGTVIFVGNRFTETDRHTDLDLGHRKLKNFRGELVSFCIDPRRRLIPIHRPWAICAGCIASDEKGNRKRKWSRDHVANNEAVRELNSQRGLARHESLRQLVKLAGDDATPAEAVAQAKELRAIIGDLSPEQVRSLLEKAKQFQHAGTGRRKKPPAETRDFEIGQKVQNLIPRTAEALKAVAELPPRNRLMEAIKGKLLPLGFTLPEIQRVLSSKPFAVTLARHWVSDSEHITYKRVATAHQLYLKKRAA